MKIGEFFLNIALKGAEAAKNQLTKVSKEMNELSSSSMLVKGALLGAVYAAEQFVTSAAAQGTAIHNYGVLTGESTIKLQEWGEVARQSGVSADQMKSSLVAAQKAMTAMKFGGGPPGGLAMISQYAGGLDEKKLHNATYVMDKLRRFANNKKLSIADRNYFLAQMGVSDDIIVALRSYHGKLSDIKRNFILDQGESNKLRQIDRQWSDLWKNLDMYKAHITAEFGLGFIKGLNNNIKFMEEMVKGVRKVTNEFPALTTAAQVAGIAIAATFAPMTTGLGLLAYLTNELQKFRDGEASLLGDPKETPYQPEPITSKDTMVQALSKFLGPSTSALYKYMNPQVAVPTTKNVHSSTVNNFHNNITHIGNADQTQAVYDTHKAAVKQTMSQMRPRKERH